MVAKIVWGAPARWVSSTAIPAGQPAGAASEGRLRRAGREYARIARLWLAWPSGLALAILLSAASVMSAVIGQYLLLRDLGGGLSLVAFTAVIGLVYVAALLPVSVNGIGVQEAALVLLLTALGVGRDQATILAVAARLLMLAVSLPGAFVVHDPLR